MANNDGNETYHEVPASRSWYLGDNFGPVTKSFLKFYTPTIFTLGIAITLITEHTNFWAVMASGFWNVAFVKLWYITLPAIGIGFVYLWWRGEKGKKRKIEQQKIQARRKKLDEIIG